MALDDAWLPGARSRGQALTEFALVLPAILLLFFAIFDLGRAVYAFNTISDGARTGSRIGIVNQDKPTIQNEAAAQAVGLGISTADVCVNFKDADDFSDCQPGGDSCSPVAIGCVAEVTMPYSFTPATPGSNILLQAMQGFPDIQMSSTTRLPVEYVCTGDTCPRQSIVGAPTATP